jgi:hypothetical protein
MEAKYPEITLGESVCSKIKQIYFSEEKSPDCHRKVADKFTLFKKIMRKIYPDSDNVEILQSVARFDTLEIQEIFDMQNYYLTSEPEKNLASLPKYDKNVVWVPVPVEKKETLGQIRKMLV